MEIERIGRYKDKLNIISERAQDIEEWARGYDLKIIPKDDYTNINILFKKKIIDSNLKNGLYESNGLRNRLVHRYNQLNDAMAFDSIQEHLQVILYFREAIEKWLRSNL